MPFALQLKMLNTTYNLLKRNRNPARLNLISYVSFLSDCWY